MAKKKTEKAVKEFTGNSLLQMVLDHPDTPKDPELILRALAWATGEWSVAIAPPGDHRDATLAIALEGIHAAKKAAEKGPFKDIHLVGME